MVPGTLRRRHLKRNPTQGADQFPGDLARRPISVDGETGPHQQISVGSRGREHGQGVKAACVGAGEAERGKNLRAEGTGEMKHRGVGKPGAMPGQMGGDGREGSVRGRQEDDGAPVRGQVGVRRALRARW